MSKKEKKAKNEKFVAAGLVVAAILLAAPFVWSFATQDVREVDEFTLCPKDAALVGHTIVLVDGTDAIPLPDFANLKSIINKEKDSLPTGEMLTLLRLGSEKNDLGSFTSEMFSACNPGTGEEFNSLNTNITKKQELWREKFGDPLDDKLDSLKDLPTAEHTPLIEALRVIGGKDNFRKGNVGRRRLVIFSDMLQSSEGFSQYGSNYSVDDLSNHPRLRNALPKLDGVDVEIYYVVRDKDAEHQGPEHRQFWFEFLQSRGAKVKFEPEID